MEDCRGQTAALDPNSPGAWDDEEEIEEKKKKEKEKEREKEKKKMKKEKSQKKQPKPTYTKVKEFNKPLGTVATAIKTLSHPLRSHGPAAEKPDDSDIVVIRQCGDTPVQTYPLVEEGRPAPAAGNDSGSCSPEEPSLDPEAEKLRALKRPPERRESRPRAVRQCWSETSTCEGCAPHEEDGLDAERPSNPTPLSARNLAREQQQREQQQREQQQVGCSGLADQSPLQPAHSGHAHLRETFGRRSSGSANAAQLVDLEAVEVAYGPPVQHRVSWACSGV